MKKWRQFFLSQSYSVITYPIPEWKLLLVNSCSRRYVQSQRGTYWGKWLRFVLSSYFRTCTKREITWPKHRSTDRHHHSCFTRCHRRHCHYHLQMQKVFIQSVRWRQADWQAGSILWLEIQSAVDVWKNRDALCGHNSALWWRCRRSLSMNQRECMENIKAFRNKRHSCCFRLHPLYAGEIWEP